MKYKPDKNLIAIGITALIVMILAVCFIYLLFNGSLFYNAIHKIVKVSMPIIYGFILAYLMSYIVDYIEQKIIAPILKKCKVEVHKKTKSKIRFVSVVLTLIVVFILVYGFLLIVVPEIYKSLQSIVSSFPTYIQNLVDFVEHYLIKYPAIEAYFVYFMEEYSETVYTWITELLPSMNELIKNLSLSVIGVIGTLWDLIIGLIIAIYMLGSKEKFAGQAKKIVYSILPLKYANTFLHDIRFIDKTFGGFISGKILDSTIIGVICFVCLQFIGTPYPLLISVIVGVTNIIPFFGPYLGAIPSALLVLMIDPKQCLYFIIFIFLLQQLDGNVIGPKILGDSTGVTGFWIIFSITVFGGLMGLPGMVIGVPTFAVFYAFISRFVRHRLAKKGMPLDTAPYMDAVDVFPIQTQPETKETENESVL